MALPNADNLLNMVGKVFNIQQKQKSHEIAASENIKFNAAVVDDDDSDIVSSKSSQNFDPLAQNNTSTE